MNVNEITTTILQTTYTSLFAYETAKGMSLLRNQNVVHSYRYYCTYHSEKLTHVNSTGKACMVDVGDKPSSKRSARARAIVKVGKSLANLIEHNNLKKGDVFTVSELAGIMGAKKTAELIPLCHNISLSKVDVNISLDKSLSAVVITATVHCTGKTGVEMEALMAVSISALTVYDMCKAVSHDIVISEILLLEKTGGQRGDFHRSCYSE